MVSSILKALGPQEPKKEWKITKNLIFDHFLYIFYRKQSNKSFANTLTPLREDPFFVYNLLLAYWTYGKNPQEVKFLEL